jgi:Type II CAAX prenyl endopeptidase Rce1-like
MVSAAPFPAGSPLGPSTAATLRDGTRSPCSWCSRLLSVCREWSSRCCWASRVLRDCCGWCSSPCSARRCWSPGWPTVEPASASCYPEWCSGDSAPGAGRSSCSPSRCSQSRWPPPQGRSLAPSVAGPPRSAGYLFNTLIFGALTLNLWEETAWAGFAQSRWMARHGLLVGSLITAVFFAAIHVPLQFEGDPSWSRILASTGLVFLTALIARYLIGMHLLDTRGSILAAGVQHAS